MSVKMKDFELSIKLPKRDKKQWIKALVSGKYKQGHNFLFMPKGNLQRDVIQKQGVFCCLGVFGICKKLEPKVLTGHYLLSDILRFDELMSSRDAFCQTISKSDPDIGENCTVESYLAALNDALRKGKRVYSFKKIAGWIERNL